MESVLLCVSHWEGEEVTLSSMANYLVTNNCKYHSEITHILLLSILFLIYLCISISQTIEGKLSLVNTFVVFMNDININWKSIFLSINVLAEYNICK